VTIHARLKHLERNLAPPTVELSAWERQFGDAYRAAVEGRPKPDDVSDEVWYAAVECWGAFADGGRDLWSAVGEVLARTGRAYPPWMLEALGRATP
jgi:hypothetical protein